MKTDLEVRKFKNSDARPLTHLLHRSYAGLGAAGMNFTAVNQSEEITLRRATDGQCWVGVVDGNIVATITMTAPPGESLRAISEEASKPDQAWINQLAVEPAMQNNGIASRLWAIGREWAETEGAQRVGLNTAERAEDLIALYSAWGFSQIETVQRPGKNYRSAIMVREVA